MKVFPVSAMPAGTTDSQRILIVDDEPPLVEALSAALRGAGFEVEEAASGLTALAAARERPPDLIVLDVTLPDLDGPEVTRCLRAEGLGMPVLFVSQRDAVDARSAGLSIGGNEFVTKPFAVAAIVARIHAMLRRTGGEPDSQGILRFADIELDENAHLVTRDGQVVSLTATEFNLLRFFLVNQRRVVSKAEIREQVWDYDFAGTDNVVELYVGYLRKKLEALGPPVIYTVRLFGYALW